MMEYRVSLHGGMVLFIRADSNKFDGFYRVFCKNGSIVCFISEIDIVAIECFSNGYSFERGGD